MRRSRVVRLVLVGTAAAVASVGGFGGGAQAVSGVGVSVHCDGSPEKVTIHNSRSHAITIISVGSTYQPRAGEPYHVNHALAADKSITYSFGQGNGPHKLSGSYIFESSAPSEAAKVKTSVGITKRYC